MHNYLNRTSPGGVVSCDIQRDKARRSVSDYEGSRNTQRINSSEISSSEGFFYQYHPFFGMTLISIIGGETYE